MAQTSRRQPTFTQNQINDLFVLMLANDTDDAPWTVLGAQRMAEDAQRAAENALDIMECDRRRAEDEAKRLRAELDRYRRPNEPAA